MTDEKQYRYRTIPGSELEFYKKLADPAWGDLTEINPDMYEKLESWIKEYDTEGKMIYDEDGKPIINKQNLWALKNYFTRDFRLANLNKEEFKYCVYCINLAGDYLSVNLLRPFSIFLDRVAAILELSQSKGGFTRKQFHTFRQETFHAEPEAPKRNLWGMGGKKKEGY